MPPRSALEIDLVGLDTVEPARLIALHSHPDVLRHLPLAPDAFGMTECRAWINAKTRQWSEHGYGPWAVRIDGGFAGWGGCQWASGDADLALVLFPRYWGAGQAICRRMMDVAFNELGLTQVTALLPTSRTRLRAMARFGFEAAGERIIDGHTFLRFVLDKPA